MSRRDVLSEFLDEPKEVHAVFHGFYAAIRSLNPKPKYDDSREEPHYWRLGYLVGKGVQILGAAAATKFGGLW
jgi:hypothetical protein